MLDGYLPKFHYLQPCVRRSVGALPSLGFYVPCLGVSEERAAVDSENLAGLCDGVPPCWVNVRFGLRHCLPPFCSLRPGLASFPC